MTPDRNAIIERLLGWLERRLEPPAFAWLTQKSGALRDGAAARQFFMAYGAATRHAGHVPLALTAAENDAAALRPGWDPTGWTQVHAARTVLLLSLTGDAPALTATLDQLCRAADVDEQVALYQALPLLPHPKDHVARCAEGVRTNMTSVFCAVAHRNPYPRENLDEAAWNQMVLKALFVGVALAPIQGLDERANTALMNMLRDYAHERWAAGRPVSPELWRCVGPYADDAARADLQRVRAEGGDRERAAAALALEGVTGADWNEFA